MITKATKANHVYGLYISITDSVFDEVRKTPADKYIDVVIEYNGERRELSLDEFLHLLDLDNLKGEQ